LDLKIYTFYFSGEKAKPKNNVSCQQLFQYTCEFSGIMCCHHKSTQPKLLCYQARKHLEAAGTLAVSFKRQKTEKKDIKNN
jgi:histidinol phosphatase-like enzyme